MNITREQIVLAILPSLVTQELAITNVTGNSLADKAERIATKAKQMAEVIERGLKK